MLYKCAIKISLLMMLLCHASADCSPCSAGLPFYSRVVENCEEEARFDEVSHCAHHTVILHTHTHTHTPRAITTSSRLSSSCKKKKKRRQILSICQNNERWRG